ncbi:MAG: ABC transporter ATP-binding protein [Planctomycetota bacterium]
MSHHIIEASELCYSYPDGTVALTGVDFLITHGESVAIVGANGAGKSTLLLHLAGCLLPTSGTLRVGDWPLTPRTVHSIRRSVGFVFQDPDDQLFMPTVFDDVAFGPLNIGLTVEEAGERVRRALDTVGAGHVARRAPYRLSGGEKRAVTIAAVLAMSPDVLVMDEPSINLDSRNRRRLIELLRSFTHTRIIATHDLDLVLDVCARTIVLAEGRVVADGPTHEVFSDAGVLDRGHLEPPLRLQGCPVCGGERGGDGGE